MKTKTKESTRISTVINQNQNSNLTAQTTTKRDSNTQRTQYETVARQW